MVTTLIYKTSLVIPGGIYLFEVNNGNTRAMCEISSKLTIKTPEQHLWRRLCVFIINFEQISHIVLVFPLLTLNKQMPAGIYRSGGWELFERVIVFLGYSEVVYHTANFHIFIFSFVKFIRFCVNLVFVDKLWEVAQNMAKSKVTHTKIYLQKVYLSTQFFCVSCGSDFLLKN